MIVATDAGADTAIVAALATVTASLCVGTPAGSQFAAVFQSVPDAPVHVFAAPSATVTVTLTVLPSAASSRAYARPACGFDTTIFSKSACASPPETERIGCAASSA